MVERRRAERVTADSARWLWRLVRPLYLEERKRDYVIGTVAVFDSIVNVWGWRVDGDDCSAFTGLPPLLHNDDVIHGQRVLRSPTSFVERIHDVVAIDHADQCY